MKKQIILGLTTFSLMLSGCGEKKDDKENEDDSTGTTTTNGSSEEDKEAPALESGNEVMSYALNALSSSSVGDSTSSLRLLGEEAKSEKRRVHRLFK